MTQGGGTAMSRGDWADAVQDIISQSSYLNVGILAEYDTLTDYINITAEVYYTDSLPVDGFGFQPTNYLNIILTRCLLYTSPSPRDRQKSRMPSSA